MLGITVWITSRAWLASRVVHVSGSAVAQPSRTNVDWVWCKPHVGRVTSTAPPRLATGAGSMPSYGTEGAVPRISRTARYGAVVGSTEAVTTTSPLGESGTTSVGSAAWAADVVT